MLRNWQSTFNLKSVKLSFYGDGDDPTQEDPTQEDPTQEDPTKDPSKSTKINFSPEQQAHVDKIVESRIAKQRAQTEKLLTQLNDVKQTTRLTQEQETKWQETVNNLEEQLMSKDQLLAKREKEAAEKHGRETKKLSEERDEWKVLYNKTTIERELADAAFENDAASVDQIKLMFRGNTTLVQDTDDEGNLIPGAYKAMLTFTGKGDNNTVQEMTLPVKDAVSKIREDGFNNNLFKHNANSGTGKKPAKGSGTTRVEDMENPPIPEDYSNENAWRADYTAWRKKNM